ncbi:MAG: ATP-dependent DNA helicase RecQ [Myxococcota bacterium]|jgi:ATP-dependent DNA helicase RecQ
MTDPLAVLTEVFGHASLRPLQDEAVRASLAGGDVELVLPTGGGKSLCYQLPAVVRQRDGLGPTLVVSPLIALMEDQAASLRARGVHVELVHSGMRWAEQREALGRADRAALIYCSPERVAVKRFQSFLQRLEVSAVAVDEAHCLSEWGHDFRPDYRKLGVLRELRVPIIAATATATPRVRQDIREVLQMEDPVRISGGFERSNLRFEVEHVSADRGRTARVGALLDEAGLGHRSSPGRAIVYASSRKRVRSLRNALAKRGFDASWYHAGRTDGARAQAQAAFTDGRAAVLVATTAFGMGVDVPDVRLVIHAQAPTTLEAWYQQAGRAGRDGEPARCVLLWSRADAVLRRRLVGPNAPPGADAGWRALESLAEGTACRQQAIVQYFTGADARPCGRCDCCTDTASVRASVDHMEQQTATRRQARSAKAARESTVTLDGDQHDTVVAFVDGLRKPVGRGLIAAGLRGSKAKRVKRVKLEDNPHFGALKGTPEVAIFRALDDLVQVGRLEPKGKKYPTLWIAAKPVRPPRRAGGSARPGAPTGLARALTNLRRREARKRRWKPYQVLTNATIAAIVTARPSTLDRLAEVKGIGPKKVERFGGAILEAVALNPE